MRRRRRTGWPGVPLQRPVASPRPSTESDCGAGIGAAVGTVEGVGAASAGGAMEAGRFFLGALAFRVAGLAALLAAAFTGALAAVFAGALVAVFLAGAAVGSEGAGLEAARTSLFFLVAATGAVLPEPSAAGADPLFGCVPVFCGVDFLLAGADLPSPAVARALAPDTGAVAAGLADASVVVGSLVAEACDEIRKSSIDAPRFFRPCLSQAGFGPRPLQV